MLPHLLAVLPQFLTYENAGWISQIFLALFLIAGGVGAYVGFKNGRREGISKRTAQTIEELETLSSTLGKAVDSLEKENKRQKELAITKDLQMREVIVLKDKQIESLQTLITEINTKHALERDELRREFETERRYLIGIIHQFEAKLGQLT